MNVGISGHTPYRSTQLIEQSPNIPFSQGSHDFDTSLSSLLVRNCTMYSGVDDAA